MSVAARSAGPPKRGAPAASNRSKSQSGGRRAGGGKASETPSRRPAGNTAKRRTTRTREDRPVRAAVPVVAAVVWAVVIIAAVAASSFLTALVLAVVAFVATASGVRAVEAARRSRSATRRPSLLLIGALTAAVLDPLVALGGPYAALAALLLTCAALSLLVLATGYAASARPLRAVGSRLVVSLGPAVAATCVVIARHQGSTLALALLAATLAYDAGAFLMGNTRTPLGGPVAIGSGVASVAVVALFAAAVMNPPFNGNRPWLVFAAVAVLAPLGVGLGQIAVGVERLPAVRRVDSLFLVAPAWVLVAALLLHR